MALIDDGLKGTVGTLILDNPEKRNAFGRAMIAEVAAAFARFEHADARAVILRARPGVKIWSAGFDIDELPTSGADPIALVEPIRTLIKTVECFPAPVIGFVEGGVWGGAFEVAMACDILVATPNATFAITPARLGIPYNISGLQTFLKAMPLRVLKEMAFTTEPITAARAVELGIVNHVVEPDGIEDFVAKMADRIAGNAPLAIRAMKEQLAMLTASRGLTTADVENVLALRQHTYDAEDYQEGLRAFRERRRPDFRGV